MSNSVYLRASYQYLLLPTISSHIAHTSRTHLVLRIMNINSSQHVALEALRYASPLCVITYYSAAQTIATCFLHRPSHTPALEFRKRISAGLLFLSCATVIGQAISWYSESFLRPGTYAPQSVVINILVSTLVYGSLLVSVIETRRPVWHPFLGACILATALETAITALQALSRTRDHFSLFRLALQVARSSIFLALSLLVGWWVLQGRVQSKGTLDETAPLLSDHAPGTVREPDYQSIPADEDDDNDDTSEADLDSDMDNDPDEATKLK